MTRAEDGKRNFWFEKLPNLLYSPELTSEGKEKVGQIAKFLRENPDFSFILYFNHISLNDPFVIVQIADMINPKNSRKLISLVSYAHLDPDKLTGRLANLGIDEVRRCGIEVVPVVQKEDVNKSDGYSEEKARSTYTIFINRLKELKNTGTTAGLMISPEGTRSMTGQMGPAESGMIAGGRLLAPVIYVPMAITYEGKFGRNKLNIGRKMKINIGEVTAQENPRDYPSVEDLMNNLAAALPEKMRGMWS
jgi:hypothetical protein